MATKKDIPPKLRPFISLGFDYHADNVTGGEAFGDCLFCGSREKLYINMENGLWSCKAGRCQKSGNTYTFIQLWHELHLDGHDTPSDKERWIELANDRQLPPASLKDEGIVFDGINWYLPVRNASGAIINLRKYKSGEGLRGLPELEVSLFGVDHLTDDTYKDEPVFLCEGEWDVIAMRLLLTNEGVEGIAVGAPGAGVWKDAWIEQFTGRDVIICYDNDLAGQKGTKRVWGKLKNRVKSIRYVQWPEQLPEGFDVRDFVSRGGTWSELKSIITEYVSDEERHEQAQHTELVKPPIRAGTRPHFDTVVEVFSEHLHMTPDMVIGLRIIMAVVLANQIEGDPLWLHIVSPPGTAKTELLMPLSACPSCYFASTLTPHSLVSGFVTPGGNDPSLLPKLDGKTFVLKDYTEILNMPRINKDEIHSTLRGAYDGSVIKHYGNGLHRDYKVRFNMLSGVTHAVFGERGASLGERFLIFHLVKGVGFHSGDAIRAAIRNVGKEKKVRHDLQDTVKNFVEVEISTDDIPEMSDDMIDRIIALSNIVAMLRATVDRVWANGSPDKLLYRPQHEMGTRLGKQLTKLAYGLSLVNDPPELGEREYDIVCRVALDTCVGFNLEAISLMVEQGAQSIDQLCEKLKLPHSTIRDQLDDMGMLGVVYKEKVPNPNGRGAPTYQFHATPIIKGYWKQAKLSKSPVVEELPEKREAERAIRRPRVKSRKG